MEKLYWRLEKRRTSKWLVQWYISGVSRLYTGVLCVCVVCVCVCVCVCILFCMLGK